MADPFSPSAGGARVRLLAMGALTCIGCGLGASLLLVAGARWAVPASIVGPVAGGGWTSRSRAWFTAEGFFAPEVAPDTERSFSWSGRTARLVAPNLYRGTAYRLTLLVSPGRPAGLAPPAVRVAVDGAVLLRTEPFSERRKLELEIPRRATSGAVVTLDVSNTFVPGAHDPRALGVAVEEVALTPVGGGFQPDVRVTAYAALAASLAVLGLLLCGLRSRLALAMAAAVLAAFTLLLLQDGAFVGTYVFRLVHIGMGVAVVGALVLLLRSRWPGGDELPGWSIAAALVVGASAIKLALFAHPLATVGDGIFQVHRATLVHAGKYFFTSITPRPFFEFPYPVALYVAALPLWRFFPTELDLVRLLRGLSLIADALVGLALYAAAWRQWRNRSTALLCAALWPLARAPFWALNNANLTNVFGQGLFGVAMGGLAWQAAGTRMSVSVWALTGACLVAAFLSHFSTVTVGVPIFCAAGLLMAAAGRRHLRRVGVLALVVALAALAVSYAAYYSHFTDVYGKTLSRVASGEGEAPTRSIVAPPLVKAKRWITGQSDDYGLPTIPALAIVASGGVMLARRRREGFTLVLAAWAVVWAGFTALGIFSPLAMRVNLAAAPLFTALAAYAVGALAGSSRGGTALAALAALVVGWDGIRVGLIAIGVTPPW